MFGGFHKKSVRFSWILVCLFRCSAPTVPAVCSNCATIQTCLSSPKLELTVMPRNRKLPSGGLKWSRVIKARYSYMILYSLPDPRSTNHGGATVVGGPNIHMQHARLCHIVDVHVSCQFVMVRALPMFEIMYSFNACRHYM